MPRPLHGTALVLRKLWIMKEDTIYLAAFELRCGKHLSCSTAPALGRWAFCARRLCPRPALAAGEPWIAEEPAACLAALMLGCGKHIAMQTAGAECLFRWWLVRPLWRRSVCERRWRRWGKRIRGWAQWWRRLLLT